MRKGQRPKSRARSRRMKGKTTTTTARAHGDASPLRSFILLLMRSSARRALFFFILSFFSYIMYFFFLLSCFACRSSESFLVTRRVTFFFFLSISLFLSRYYINCNMYYVHNHDSTVPIKSSLINIHYSVFHAPIYTSVGVCIFFISQTVQHLF